MEYAMDTPILVEDGALDCHWPFTSDQWEASVNPFFAPLELLGDKSDVAESQPFSDDVIFHKGYNSAWSIGSSYLEEVWGPDSSLTVSDSPPSPEHVGKGMDVELLETRQSPCEELPISPEVFGVIDAAQLHGETYDSVEPWQLSSHVSRSLAVAGPVENCSMEFPDGASVPKCELSADDLLLEAINDVIADPRKLLDIGLFLPPVSADDVESLLSSCPSEATVPTSATLNTGSLPVLDASLLAFSVEPIETETLSSLEKEITTVSFPNTPEVVPVPSPASSQSSGSSETPVDRKRRKKEQNKTAAQKYREKKRDEKGLVFSECEQLERRNIELRTKVEEMTREVDYLKGLIEEICA